MPLFTSPFADLDLIRQPEQANDPLLAFDAADQYLLEHLAHRRWPTAGCWCSTTASAPWPPAWRARWT
jgi:16S rRNA (guanine1207-N2)-methyltransferase